MGKRADRYQDVVWSLLQPAEEYVYIARDDRPSEKSYGDLGRTFPHALKHEKMADFYSALRFTPMFDELTIDFAKYLVERERVGQTGATDVLAISLSATDYIGHAFGPNSLEAEDNLVRVDRLLADFFRFLDARVGLDRTLIALSSDHGIAAVPEHMTGLGITAGRHYPERVMATVNEALKAKYGVRENLVKTFVGVNVYLDGQAVQHCRLSNEEVQRAVADELLKIDGFAKAITRTDLLRGDLTSDPISAKVQRAFHPGRSGDVMVVQEMGWYLYDKPDAFSAMHGSPYAYDAYVPIMFAGPGLKPSTVDRSVGPEDIAPTIAAYLRIDPPTGSTGTPLREVIESTR
jgi:predicted AlkP superfamily pyrophosphatase or phosphodiesterase